MARYSTLAVDDAARALEQIAKLEPLIVDGKLMAVIAGPLRIYAKKDEIVVSQQEDQQP